MHAYNSDKIFKLIAAKNNNKAILNNESSSLILKYAPFVFTYENAASACFEKSLEIELEFNSK